jgi:hypothetical protein
MGDQQVRDKTSPEGALRPHALTLLKNAAANLEILHLHPEQVQPLRFTEIAAYRTLLNRVAHAATELCADLDDRRED